jgi:hypothetical protein
MPCLVFPVTFSLTVGEIENLEHLSAQAAQFCNKQCVPLLEFVLQFIYSPGSCILT